MHRLQALYMTNVPRCVFPEGSRIGIPGNLTRVAGTGQRESDKHWPSLSSFVFVCVPPFWPESGWPTTRTARDFLHTTGFWTVPNSSQVSKIAGRTTRHPCWLCFSFHPDCHVVLAGFVRSPNVCCHLLLTRCLELKLCWDFLAAL